jgi:hypothetical protein
MKKTRDGRHPLGVTPVPETPEHRGRAAVNMIPIPGAQNSTAQTATESGAAANQPTKIGDVSGGRDALALTPISGAGDPLEKGRGGVPMVPVPPVPKPASETPTPEKKK